MMEVPAKKRIGELDFLKCVFILLMVVFHLVYIGDKYPYAKDLVYTFHIPAFLLISGYLMPVEKKAGAFMRSMFWIFIPYLVMESGYVLMSSILPVREKIDNLTLDLFMEKIFLSPMGPYWYLHTLILCGVGYYVVTKLMKGVTETLPMLITLSLVYVGLSYGVGLILPSSALYFMLGCILKQVDIPFLSFFRGSWWSVAPFILLTVYPENLERFTLAGILITYLAVSLVLAIYKLLPHCLQTIGCYIGSHSLLLLVFSPLFTISVKPLIPLFAFDSTGMVFLFVALSITVVGCFSITWVMDKMGISRFFFGKDRALLPCR